jgi:hypothetical protein
MRLSTDNKFEVDPSERSNEETKLPDSFPVTIQAPFYQVRDHIVLERWENSLIQKLLRCVQECHLKVTIRVAGGWVRDKLLGRFLDPSRYPPPLSFPLYTERKKGEESEAEGRPSDDIDLALEGMTGADFAVAVHDYLEGSFCSCQFHFI